MAHVTVVLALAVATGLTMQRGLRWIHYQSAGPSTTTP
jgi:hypothetical protein